MGPRTFLLVRCLLVRWAGHIESRSGREALPLGPAEPWYEYEEQMSPVLILLLLSVPLTAAGNLIAGRYALDSFSPAQANALRYLLALLLLAPMLRRWPAPSRRELPILAATGILGICVYNLLFFRALKIIPASEAGLLEMTIPAASLFLAWLFLRERVSRRQIVGMVISWCGTIWLLRIIPAEAATAKPPGAWRGEALMLTAVAIFAVYSIVSKFAMARLPPPAVATWSCLFGCIPLLALTVPAFVTEPSVLSGASVASWLGVVYGGVVGFVYNIIAWYYCFRRVGVARTNIFLYLVPIFGALMAVPIFNERLTGWQIFGAAITTFGVVLATAQSRRAASPAAEAAVPAAAPAEAAGRAPDLRQG